MGITIDRELAAQIVGIIAAVVLWASFQCKNTKRLFLMQLISSTIFSLHFLLLGAYTGMILNLAEVLRSYLLYQGNKKWASHRITMIAVMLMFAVSGAITWDGWLSLLPTAAMVLGTLFMWSRNGKTLRFAMLFFISPCWLVYNIAMGSIAGVLTEVVNIASIIISFLRFGIKELDKTYEG
jgi:hypothetical protein